MATYSWSGPHGGTWSNPSNWTPNGIPGSADQALIDLPGSYVVTLDVAEIGSLTLDAAGVAIAPTGPLTLTGILDVQAGTFMVAHTVTGGTLIADGGTIDYAGGMLDGVTIQGTMDLSAAKAAISIENGIAFAGSGPAQIMITGNGSSLTLAGTQMLDHVAITLGSMSGTANLAVGALTLGANASLTTIGSAPVSYTSFDNKGTITAAGGGFNNLSSASSFENEGSFTTGGFGHSAIERLTNTGTISVAGGNTQFWASDSDNLGTVHVSNGADYVNYGTFVNTGTFTLDQTSTLEFQGTETYADLGTIHRNGGTVILAGTVDVTGATIDLTSGSSLDGATFRGTMQGGTIDMDGGHLRYGPNATFDDVTVDGTIDLSGGAIGNSAQQLTIENGLNSGNAAPLQILDTGPGAVVAFADNETLHGVDITVGNANLYFAETLTLDQSSVLTLTGGATVSSISGGSTQYGNGTLDNKGTITDTTGSIESLSGTIENEGSFLVGDGAANFVAALSNAGMTSVSGPGSVLSVEAFTNSGTLQIANGGRVAEIYQRSSDVGPSFKNSGSVQLASGGTLAVSGVTGSIGTVSFLDRTGTLILGAASSYGYGGGGNYSGTLGTFRSGDVLELLGSGYSLTHAGNTLTVSQNGSVADSFTLIGQNYTNATFTLTSVGAVDATITTDAPCFCEGTRILTNQGECAVEMLAVGDVVVTRQDGVETLLPVRWIGCRRVVVAQHHAAEHVDPIRVARDAIAPGLPARDLFVSPDHALYLDGMLIQARQLVNHMTITRDSGRAVVTYYHVELDSHAILLADGMPCESYLDTGNRDHFDAAGSVVALHGATPDRVQEACAPLVSAAVLVQPIWQRLAGRARAAGHAELVPQLAPDAIPWLETEQGVRLTPDLKHDRLSFTLPPGCLRVRLRSPSDLPTTLAPWSDDRRRLGVAISAVMLRQGNWRQDLELAELDAGWWPLETAESIAWRWTDGDGWIELPEPAQSMDITLHAVMPVPVSSEGTARAKVG